MLSESSPQLEDKSNILRFDASLTYTNVIIASEKVVILIWNRWEEEPSPLPSVITEAVQDSAWTRIWGERRMKPTSNLAVNLVVPSFLNYKIASFCCDQEFSSCRICARYHNVSLPMWYWELASCVKSSRCPFKTSVVEQVVAALTVCLQPSS